jgi:type VI protein secretion system component VasF
VNEQEKFESALAESAASTTSASATSKNDSNTEEIVPVPKMPAAQRRPVRVGTIVWGGILLIIAGLTLAATFLNLTQNGPSLWVWGAIGVGVLLVLAGIVGAIVRVATRGQ